MRGKLAALAALGLVTGLLVPSAHAGGILSVNVGADVPKGFSTRVYAPLVNGVPTIKIHNGDTVNLMGGLGLLPNGTGPYEFYADNGGGVDRPISFFQTDPDPDLEDPFPSEAVVKFNSSFFTDVGCGGDAGSPCSFDASGPDFFNPGDREPYGGNLFVEIDSAPNTTVWAVNGYAPNSGNTLRIQIVPGGDAGTTQTEVDAAFDELHARDVDHAKALDAKLIKKATSHKVGNNKVWDAFVGYDTNVLALFAMYPETIELDKGDKVRFHFDQLGVEFHSAVFPADKAKQIAADGFLPVCDPDGDAGSANDNFTVDFETFTCEAGTGTLEVDLTKPMTAKAGNGTFNGNDLENSGLRGLNVPTGVPGLAGGGDHWDLKFSEKSNANGFKYICGFHGAEMKGFVVVK